ncbi:hypothetical protein JCM8097_006387 [Rhodosporidiobolus ruineniae]
MKYLFAAIDARQARPRDGQRGRTANGRSSRPRYHPDELKRLIVEASEAVDDKSAASDFQETLERIVGEIRNTTEHSGPFLQKVRKADVPDYYDVIKRPMDLATLLKKVKQQAYRSKKAFAEDLDLIWSNCLLYNSHPSHPLRNSAEILRAKSNQLLEFITDPAATQRTLYTASMSSAALDARRGSSVRIGTPDEDGDADGESDDERRSKRALSERLLNGVNGDHRDSSASPGPSRSVTPGLGRRLSRKLSQAPLERISASPEPAPPPTELPFEERPAFVRTSEGMQTFLLLDAELSKLEGRGFKPSSTSSSAILPASAFSSADEAPAAGGKGKPRLVSRIRQLNPYLLPPPPAKPALEPNGTATPSGVDTPSASASAAPTPAALASPPPPPVSPRNPDEPLEAVWWDLVAPVPSSSALFGSSSSSSSAAASGGTATNGHAEQKEQGEKSELGPPSMVAGMPRMPWVGYRATPYETATGAKGTKGIAVGVAAGKKSKGKGKGKGRAVEPAVLAEGEGAVREPKKGRKKRVPQKREGGEEKGLAGRMRRNCETLRRIRSVGTTLEREAASGELDSPDLSSDDFDLDLPSASTPDGDAMDVDSADPPAKKRRRLSRSVAVATSIPRKAFRCPATAPAAAKEAMRATAGGVLGHAGFEGASTGAVDVLAQLAGEYITNLGRTLRFYSDRYGADLTPKQILTNALSENGVPTPAALESYVTEDIDRYGSRLSDLLRKLERAREEQLDTALSSAPPAETTAEEDALFEENGLALALGEFAGKVGEDFFGLAELGVGEEPMAASASLVPPTWLLKGEPRPDTTGAAGATLTYSPPPGFVPLIPEAIPAQIGLLQPYYTLRASLPSLSLEDDASALLHPSPATAALLARPKGATRHKVPPHGRIPFKGKKRPDDPTITAAMAAAMAASSSDAVVKKKKKKAAAVPVAAPAEQDTVANGVEMAEGEPAYI